MAKKIAKKSLLWILILSLVVVVMVSFNPSKKQAKADEVPIEVPTSVTVLSAGPTLSNEREDPASYSGSPTNVGSDVTFKGTGTDPNGDRYYLAICTTDAITPNSDAPPTCDDGEWCISSDTESGVGASCNYTTLEGDAESNDWYAFACDKTATSPSCSAAGQGSNESGSPFKVNHRPSFTVYADDSPKDPGETVTWTTTASDSDTDDSNDTVTLYVCKTNSFTPPATCDGSEWCHSDASASDPTCDYELPVPYQDKDLDAYGFVVDSHGFEADPQGGNSTLTVSNVAPSITAATIQLLDTDESGNLTLTAEEDETSDFLVKFVVVDNNSCLNASNGDEIASAITHVYRSGIGQVNCDDDGEDDNNNCYANAQGGTSGQCVQDTSVNPCSGANDSDVGWRCEFPLQYHADPTVDNTQYPTENWLASVKAADDNAADTGLVEDTDGNEMDMFMAYDLNDASIAYGNLNPGDDSVEQDATLEATGNIGLDENLSGTDMASDGEHIDVGQQHYNLTASQGWPSGTTLTDEPTEAELNCQKTTVTDTPATKDTYWLLRVPNGQAPGIYNGTDTIAGVTGEAEDW